MKSMEIKDHGMHGLVMVERDHEGDDENSLLEHKHHKSQQTLLDTSKTVATNSFETLSPWSC
jgi:hypothetical protein